MASVYLGMPNWLFGIGPQGIGLAGALINFVLTVGLSPLFPAPSAAVQQMVEQIREPLAHAPPETRELVAKSA